MSLDSEPHPQAEEDLKASQSPFKLEKKNIFNENFQLKSPTGSSLLLRNLTISLVLLHSIPSENELIVD